MTTYTSGEWSIERDQHGSLQGVCWGLWRGRELVATSRTLKGCKRIAARMGQTGEWTKGRVTVEVVE